MYDAIAICSDWPPHPGIRYQQSTFITYTLTGRTLPWCEITKHIPIVIWIERDLTKKYSSKHHSVTKSHAKMCLKLMYFDIFLNVIALFLLSYIPLYILGWYHTQSTTYIISLYHVISYNYSGIYYGNTVESGPVSIWRCLIWIRRSNDWLILIIEIPTPVKWSLYWN